MPRSAQEETPWYVCHLKRNDTSFSQPWIPPVARGDDQQEPWQGPKWHMLYIRLVGQGYKETRHEMVKKDRATKGFEDSAAETFREAQHEIRHLKETITVLRDELETQGFDKERAVQEAVLTSNDEIQQLRQTAIALRVELEDLQFEHAKAVQEAASTNLDETQQLKHTISALREELEAQAFEHLEKFQNVSCTSRDEIDQLQQTIVALRAELIRHVPGFMEDGNG